MSAAVETRQVDPDEAETRVDRWFKRHYPELSHGRLEKLLRTGQVRVDGKRVKANQRLAAGQTVRVPPIGGAETMATPTVAAKARRPAENDPIVARLREAVLYMDDEVLVLNKPAGLAVQGGSGTIRHVDAALDHLRFGAAERPRLVHRLDKDTSGALALARTAAAARRLALAFRSKATLKLYWALVVGEPRPAEGEIDAPLAKQPGRAGEKMEINVGGKRALTRYRTVERLGGKVSWMALVPVTGRTHQLRVHMAGLGCPILGDGKYGGQAAFLQGEGVSRKLHLHARALRLPGADGRPVEVVAPLADHMRRSWSFFALDEAAETDPFEGFRE